MYRRHRFPSEIISHAVCLYHRFCLSFRDVEDILAERGVEVFYESIRQWCNRFGPDYAHRLKMRRGRLGDTWFLDEVIVTVMSLVPHCTDPYANNRAELSHEPTRLRERQMRRFKSMGQAQRFLSVHGVIGNQFRLGRHLLRSRHYREFRDRAFAEWQLATCA